MKTLRPIDKQYLERLKSQATGLLSAISEIEVQGGYEFAQVMRILSFRGELDRSITLFSVLTTSREKPVHQEAVPA